MTNRSCLLALVNQLRQSLGRVAQEVQDAFNDGAVVMEDDLTMLCADEAEKTIKEQRGCAKKTTENYAHTLFYFSSTWLSDTRICH